MTTLTPPPVDSAPVSPAPPSPRRPRRTASRVVAILVIALGGVLLVGALTTGALTTVFASAAGSETRTLDVTGVTDLEVDASATDLRVVFADVDVATLAVVDGRTGWRLDRDGDELRVESPRSGPFSFWFGGNGSATLTLPRSLEGSDASLSLSAGSLSADGSFAELDVQVSSGDLTVTGDARSLSAGVSAGSADLRLDGVSDAEFDLSAGGMTAELTGRTPREVQIDVSAGSLELLLPPGTYDVRSDVSAGGLDNRLEAGRGGGSGTVDVQVSAGDVTLLPGG
jgi:hypothetical protein